MHESQAMTDGPEQSSDDLAEVRDMFPATDPIAQFVVVIRAQRDDLAETATQVVKRAQTDDDTVHYYHRLLVSHYFEAMKWFEHAAKNTDVADWLAGFTDAEPRAAIEAALASTKPGGLVKSVLWSGRQTTFHYPRIGADDLEQALEAIGGMKGQMGVERREQGVYLRASFVEELMVGRLLHTFGDDAEEGMREVRDAAIAHVQLADTCLRRYMKEGDFRFGDPVFSGSEQTESAEGS